MNDLQNTFDPPVTPPEFRGGFVPYLMVMTEEELIRFLRIPEISQATDCGNVIQNLKRTHGLPRIHLCGKTAYLADSVRHWLQQRVIYSSVVDKHAFWYNGAWTNPSLRPASGRR